MAILHVAIIELYPVFFSWKWGAFISTDHIIPFFTFAYELIIQFKVKGQLSTYFKNVAFETCPEILFKYFTHSFIMEYIEKFKTHLIFQYLVYQEG